MFSTRSRLASIAAAELSMTKAVKAEDTRAFTEALREATAHQSSAPSFKIVPRIHALPALHASSKTRRKGENREQHRARRQAENEAATGLRVTNLATEPLTLPMFANEAETAAAIRLGDAINAEAEQPLDDQRTGWPHGGGDA